MFILTVGSTFLILFDMFTVKYMETSLEIGTFVLYNINRNECSIREGGSMRIASVINQFEQRFPTDEACLSYLVALKWPNGYLLLP